MSKATHNGTCQACGAHQAVRANGRLANHGYTVEYGFFSGICPGSDKAPLEQERTFADSIIADLTDRANQLMSIELEDITEVSIRNPAFSRFGKGSRLPEFVTARSDQQVDRIYELAGKNRYGASWERLIQSELETKHRRAEAMLTHCEGMAELIKIRHGMELMERERKEERERGEKYGIRTAADAWKIQQELEKEGWEKFRYNRGSQKLTYSRGA